MSDMKKDYVKPYLKVILLDGGEDIIQTSSSFVDIGGTTDSFNSRYGSWDEYEEE